MTITIHELCRCIKRRYGNLNDFVIALYDGPMRKVDVDIKICDIKHMNIILHDTVGHFNAIFGMFGIYLFTNSLLSLLLICESMIGAEMDKFHSVVYLIIQNVYTLIMIISCDRVEKCAKKLLKTSYRLQMNTENDRIIKDLRYLSKVIGNLSPEFTALGFFRFNQQLIPAFLSTMAGYVIILMQFHTELIHSNNEE
ncbi:hypothetical protein JTB14_029261 [Gonioctena quinquepunctata]|nr:hypothetical protein JTB14_029261 [Gonioctena quinquepunctata]